MNTFEDIGLYHPGGFHPVHLGDMFHNNRYVIEHKLGHGGHSTVWLARDLHMDRLVALKIDAADLSTRTEAWAFRRLSTSPSPPPSPQSSPQPTMFPLLLDEFIITGPNGSHGCIVMEVLGPSLWSCSHKDFRNGCMPIKVSRRVATRVALAVAEMHECGIVHGGWHPPHGQTYGR